MSLDAALGIAGSGLAAINRQLGLVSHNVANASTPGYAVESAADQSVTAGGQGMGVRTAQAQRATDQVLQASLLQQNTAAAGAQTTATALGAVDAAHGSTNDGTDLASLLGKLQDSFSALLATPADSLAQQGVTTAAASLAGKLNSLSATVTQQRQAAQDALASQVGQVNTDLATIGQLSDQIIAAKARGESTADLENQRDAQISVLSQFLPVTTIAQPNGDMIVATTNGLVLPTRFTQPPLAIASATTGPNAYYPGGGLPGLTLNNVDVTASLTGGTIGANLTLRDTTLPTAEAELDEFAQNLAAGFASAGLPLFSTAAGTVPAGGGSPAQSGYVGFAAAIQANAAVQANPASVRDGLPSANASNLAGFSTVIGNVLGNVLGAAPLAATQVSGLGPAGNLAASYAAPATLADFAAILVASQSGASASAASAASNAQSVQSSLQTKLSSATGVNMDTEMSDMIALQNAYAANAKIIGAVQSMYAALLGMYNP